LRMSKKHLSTTGETRFQMGFLWHCQTILIIAIVELPRQRLLQSLGDESYLFLPSPHQKAIMMHLLRQPGIQCMRRKPAGVGPRDKNILCQIRAIQPSLFVVPPLHQHPASCQMPLPYRTMAGGHEYTELVPYLKWPGDLIWIAFVPNVWFAVHPYA